MRDLPIAVLAVDLVLDLVAVIHRQRDVDVDLRAADDRLRPDRVAQLEDRAVGLLRPRLCDRGPRHLEIRDAGQHLLRRVAVDANPMIGEEEFVARERRAEALRVEVGCVEV